MFCASILRNDISDPPSWLLGHKACLVIPGVVLGHSIPRILTAGQNFIG